VTSQNLPWIFAVEDSESDMYLLERALNQGPQPPSIRRARDGEEALAVLLELADAGRDRLPQVILIDLNLPRIDGYEILSHLRSQEVFEALPVVAISSSQALVDRRKAIAAGADAYFVKPLDLASYGRLPSVIDEARRARSHKLMLPPNGDANLTV
jgi:CheY-like chemotaxis protein